MSKVKLRGRFYQMSPPEHFRGLQEEEIEVELDRAALLVVDVYGHGFEVDQTTVAHPSSDKKTDKEWDEVTIRFIKPALEAARMCRLPVVYAHNSAPNIEINRSELGKQLRRSLVVDLEALLSERPGLVDQREYKVSPADSHLLDIAASVRPQTGDYFIRKHFYSGFKDTRLDTLLRNLDVKTLFCLGFDSSVCLLCTIIDAFELNYEVILLRDAVRALEIPEDQLIGYSFTDRMIKWVEAMIGRSITTPHFVEMLGNVNPQVRKIKVG